MGSRQRLSSDVRRHADRLGRPAGGEGYHDELAGLRIDRAADRDGLAMPNESVLLFSWVVATWVSDWAFAQEADSARAPSANGIELSLDIDFMGSMSGGVTHL